MRAVVESCPEPRKARWRTSCVFLAAGFALASLAAARPVRAAGELPVFNQVAGEIRRVTVVAGDTLVGIAARVGVPWQTLARANRIDDPNRIRPGQVIEVDTRRVVPAVLDEGLVLNVPEASLYVFERGSLVARHGVGLGRPARPTPLGSLTVLDKRQDATWRLAPSLVVEDEREGILLRQKEFPADDTSLGRYWIQLSVWGYGIHASAFSSSVGQYLSHGSVRLHPAAMEALFARVRKGTRVENLYLPVKLAITPAGEIWAEVHGDPYGRGIPASDEVRRALEREDVLERVDSVALERALGESAGVARKIGSAPLPVSREKPDVEPEPEVAAWECLDCPPGTTRRVTFQIRAGSPIDLPNPFPIEVRDDAERVVFRPSMVAQTIVHLEPGQSRNFVWEVRDTEGQPLPPGSYKAIVQFFTDAMTQRRTLSLPLWVAQ